MMSKCRILVVDDEPLLRSLLVDTLSAIGYEADAASDGVDALTLLREHESSHYGLLITDVKMPNMDGITLLRRIRRAYPHLPVLFITGVVSEEAMAAAGPDGYLCKPFRIEMLEKLIETTLAEATGGHRPPPPRRILIDVADPKICESLAETLSSGDYLPFAVAGGDEALEELQRGSFDAIIAGLDGQPSEAHRLERLRDLCPDLPLLLTGSPRTAEEIESVRGRLRADAWIPRPCPPGELIALVDRVLEPKPGDGN
jgi:DNA-binding response OmpR family regulator